MAASGASETSSLLGDSSGSTRTQKLKEAARHTPGKIAAVISNIWVVNVLFFVVICVLSGMDILALNNCPENASVCLFGGYFTARNGLSATAAGLVLTRWYRRFVENCIFNMNSHKQGRCGCLPCCSLFSSTSVLMGLLLLGMVNVGNVFLIYENDRSDLFIWNTVGMSNIQIFSVWFVGSIIRIYISCSYNKHEDRDRLIMSVSNMWRIILPLVLINATVTLVLVVTHDWNATTNEILVHEVIITSVVGLSGFGSMFGSLGIVGKKAPPIAYVVLSGCESGDGGGGDIAWYGSSGGSDSDSDDVV